MQVVGDNVNEEDETFFVNLSGASVNSTLADNQASGTIYDDDGFLTFIEAESLALIEALYGVSGLAVSPDGAHLYATGQFDDAISVFSRNSTNGALTFIEVLRDGDVQGLLDHRRPRRRGVGRGQPGRRARLRCGLQRRRGRGLRRALRRPGS